MTLGPCDIEDFKIYEDLLPVRDTFESWLCITKADEVGLGYLNSINNKFLNINIMECTDTTSPKSICEPSQSKRDNFLLSHNFQVFVYQQ